jgi:hopene-associated glycosyltransferase HpnB
MTVFLASFCLCIWLYLTFLRSGFWRFKDDAGNAPIAEQEASWPRIVAIVPARNEAAHIGGCVRSLLSQRYGGEFSVVVIDDASSDATASMARGVARELQCESRLEVIRARALPPGWTGKVWAQAEGVEHVRAESATRALAPEFLWFTDADIVHRPGVLQGLVAQSRADRLVLNSHMVHLRCTSFAERSLIPAFVFFFAMLYPFGAVNNPRRRIAAAAGGSMLVQRLALEQAGGLASIRGALIDDCALSAVLKQQGPIRLALGHASFSIRAYPEFRDIWMMVARTAYTQLGYSPLVLLGTVIGLFLTYIVPPVMALTAHGLAALIAGCTWLLMAVCFAPICRYYRRFPGWGVALPVIATFYLAATLGSAWNFARGRGGQWKDRHQANAAAAVNAEALDEIQPR